MNELDLNSLLLSWIIGYGAPVVAGAQLLGALGMPVPTTLILLAAGAFARQDLLNIYMTTIGGFVGAMVGEAILFGIGRFAKSWIEKRFGQTTTWTRAKDFFERRGGIAIYLSRWLLTAAAPPTTLIAGSSGYTFVNFLLFAAAGHLTGIILYGGLGYGFGNQWELISALISQFGALILSLAVLGLGVYLVIRFRKKPTPELAPDR